MIKTNQSTTNISLHTVLQAQKTLQAQSSKVGDNHLRTDVD